jgi:hypothetical protein
MITANEARIEKLSEMSSLPSKAKARYGARYRGRNFD